MLRELLAVSCRSFAQNPSGIATLQEATTNAATSKRIVENQKHTNENKNPIERFTDIGMLAAKNAISKN